MNYSAIEFLMLFPLYCLVYWSLRGQRARLAWILAGSLLFYAYGDLAGLPVLGVVGFLGGSGSTVGGRARRWSQPASSLSCWPTSPSSGTRTCWPAGR